MSATRHSQTRMQQRGIPPLIIQWLEAFGEEHHDHHGAVILHFSKRSRRRLEQNFGSTPIRKMSEWMNAYAVKRLRVALADGACSAFHATCDSSTSGSIL